MESNGSDYRPRYNKRGAVDLSIKFVSTCAALTIELFRAHDLQCSSEICNPYVEISLTTGSHSQIPASQYRTRIVPDTRCPMFRTEGEPETEASYEIYTMFLEEFNKARRLLISVKTSSTLTYEEKDEVLGCFAIPLFFIRKYSGRSIYSILPTEVGMNANLRRRIKKVALESSDLRHSAERQNSSEDMLQPQRNPLEEIENEGPNRQEPSKDSSLVRTSKRKHLRGSILKKGVYKTHEGQTTAETKPLRRTSLTRSTGSSFTKFLQRLSRSSSSTKRASPSASDITNPRTCIDDELSQMTPTIKVSNNGSFLSKCRRTLRRLSTINPRPV